MTATGIKNYSSTPASNSSAAPNGFPEGMAPSGVNDAARQMMAEVRRWYEDALWYDFGYTYTYVSTTSFKVSGTDVTAQYAVGRRLRAIGSGTGTIYGVVATSAFSSDTTVTITWDSGTLSNETLAISVGPSVTGTPIPYAAVSGLSAAPTDATISITDVTTNNGSSTKHGWLPKSPADATKFLNGAATPAYANPKDSDLAFTDITTNDVSTSKHGFVPKSPNDATKYLDGTGAYSTPAGTPAGMTVIASGNCATGSPTVIDMNSIPATYRSLVLFVSGASNSVSSRALRIQVSCGGDSITTTQSVPQYFSINNATVTSNSTGSIAPDILQTAAQISSAVINFPAYQSGPIKQYNGFLGQGAASGNNFVGGTTGFVFINGVLNGNGPGAPETRAITSIRLTWDNVGAGVFDAGTYALYGVN